MNDFGLLVSKYNASLPTLTDGQLAELQVDVNGRLLVQADVSVVIDALGLNGASDNSNIIIVGTEDGTGAGTKHAVRVTSNGSVVVSAVDLDIRDLAFATDKVDVSGSTNVAVVDGGGSLTVDAVDLDIRDLTHVSDSVKVGDGTDFLAINADGSINAQATIALAGTEEYATADALAPAGDGIIVVAGVTFVDICSISHTSGVLHLYGYEWCADQNADARIVTDDGVDVIVYKRSLNSSSQPTVVSHFADSGRIEIAGSAGLNVKLQIRKRAGGGGNANCSGSMHARKV
jgi:hypothetical protein